MGKLKKVVSLRRMSDADLVKSVEEVLRAEIGEDVVAAQPIFDELELALPHEPHRVLHVIVANSVKEEVLIRWLRAQPKEACRGE